MFESEADGSGTPSGVHPLARDPGVSLASSFYPRLQSVSPPGWNYDNSDPTFLRIVENGD